jgi:hypothetical protein
MKNLVIVLIALFHLLVGNLLADCPELDYSKLTWRQIAVDQGKLMLHYCIDSNGSVTCAVVCPINPQEGLRIKPDRAKGGNHLVVKIQYRGLTLDGPLGCRPVVVCLDKQVRRHLIKLLSEKDLLRDLEKMKNMVELENYLKKG